jgi:hypothetical protein
MLAFAEAAVNYRMLKPIRFEMENGHTTTAWQMSPLLCAPTSPSFRIAKR